MTGTELALSSYRKLALAANSMYYFTGKFCRCDHLSPRYASGGCIMCLLMRQKTDEYKKVKAIHHQLPEVNSRAQERNSRFEVKERRKVYEHSQEYKNTIKARREWRKENDPQYVLMVSLRNRMKCAIRGKFKSGPAVSDLGMTIPDFMKYIEAKWQLGMTWKNLGKVWQLDHIKPLGLFDLTNKEQFLKAANYTNLQPLFTQDHMNKSIQDCKKIRFARMN